MASLAPRLLHARSERRRVAVALAGVALVALLIVLATSSGGSNGGLRGPVPAGAAGPITTVVAFGDALSRRDFKGICDRLFTPAARDGEGGPACPSQLAAAADATLVRPRLVLQSIIVRGSIASANVVLEQPGSPSQPGILGLERSGGAWRIASAGGTGD